MNVKNTKLHLIHASLLFITIIILKLWDPDVLICLIHVTVVSFITRTVTHCMQTFRATTVSDSWIYQWMSTHCQHRRCNGRSRALDISGARLCRNVKVFEEINNHQLTLV